MRIEWIGMIAAISMVGCTNTEVRQGGSRAALGQSGRVLLAPFHNATPDETAGRALTEITSTALISRGVPLVQTEEALARTRAFAEEGREPELLGYAQSLGVRHVIIGTVHEYRYKSDLDGLPVVGTTMRLVDSADGRTLWQGTSAKFGGYWGSLSRAARQSVDSLLWEMISGRPSREVTRSSERATGLVTTGRAPVGRQPDDSFGPVYSGQVEYAQPALAPVPLSRGRASGDWSAPAVTTDWPEPGMRQPARAPTWEAQGTSRQFTAGSVNDPRGPIFASPPVAAPRFESSRPSSRSVTPTVTRFEQPEWPAENGLTGRTIMRSNLQSPGSRVGPAQNPDPFAPSYSSQPATGTSRPPVRTQPGDSGFEPLRRRY